MNPHVVYPVDGNLVDKGYMASLPDELLAKWRPFSVCGYPDFPAYFILDPTAMTHGTSFSIPFPRAHCAFGFLSLSERRGTSSERQFPDDRGGIGVWCAPTLPGECSRSFFQGSV